LQALFLLMSFATLLAWSIGILAQMVRSGVVS
jgi:hypothetical protein